MKVSPIFTALRRSFFGVLFLAPLWGLLPLCSHAATLAPPVTAEQEATALLRQAARGTQDIRTLYATFTQKKQLSILSTPLTSSGYMCLERGQGVQNTEDTRDGAEKILWAYEKPTVSGFAQEAGQAWLWTGEKNVRRPAQGPEAMALKAVAAQILAWVRIRPEELERLYRMERVGHDNTLRLTPRQSGLFFSRLEVTLTPELSTVRRLLFVEKNGDSTELLFHDARVNAVLPLQCATPKPQ